MANRKAKRAVWIAADTEDNSVELCEQGKSTLENKRLTQVYAVGSNGKKFYAAGPEGAKSFLCWCQSLTFRHDRVLVYFHNLQYDLGNLFARELDAIDQTLVGGRVIRARWGKVEFRDSWNIFNFSLATLAKSFGTVKGKLDARSRAYIEQDVEILRRALAYAKKFAGRFGVEELPCTAGGLAVKVWHALGGSNWQCCEPICRQALFGGRTELFCSGGTGSIYYTDVNSLYPWAMTQPFPDESAFCNGLPAYGVAEVTIDVPRQFIAPLPLRREDGSVFFPCGTFRGVWTVAELEEACRHGAKVLKVHNAFGSQTASAYYSSFVHRIYGDRLKAGTEAEKLMLKLVMNSLFGQLGMAGEVGQTLPLRKEDTRALRGVPFGSKVLVKMHFPLPEHVNWLHCAYVTAYGRIALQRFLRAVPPDRLIYCDTDSVFFFWPDKEALPFKISKELGEMKLEAQCSEVQVKAPKLYKIDGQVKAKGVPKRFQPQFFQYGFVEFDMPYRMREAIAYFDRDNARPLSVWHRVAKYVRTVYDKKRKVNGHFLPLTIRQA